MSHVSMLGETLRLRREELGRSQHELARACGVGQQTISRWENGEDIPRPARVLKLAQVLGLDADELHALAGYLPQRRRSVLSPAFGELYARAGELSDDEVWLLADRLWTELRRRRDTMRPA